MFANLFFLFGGYFVVATLVLFLMLSGATWLGNKIARSYRDKYPLADISLSRQEMEIDRLEKELDK